MVFRQLNCDFLHERFPETVRAVQHHRLIPVMVLRDALFEKPMLDRTEHDFAFHRPFFGCYLGRDLNIAADFLNRRIRKHIPDH
ncbi:hypothetical protein D3C73_938690 [compost metagenome]